MCLSNSYWISRSLIILLLSDILFKELRAMKVCVIGGGAAGLCAVRHLARDLDFFEIVAFEQIEEIGGTWVYNDQTDSDQNLVSVHSSMYKSLRTNLPGEVMNFPDFPKLISTENSCFSHDEVLQYLHDYADEFQLRQYIQFGKEVENVSPIVGSKTFNVRVKNIKSGNVTNHVCDAVIVCNGHYSVPYIPDIPGIETFSGKIMHSHSYRKPEGFQGKRVILLGGSYSGIDISIDLIAYATNIYLSHNKPSLSGRKPPKIIEVPGIKSVTDNVFHLLDGTSVTADVLIFCTGYKYDFPFLDDKLGVIIDEKFVSPLYKHMIHANYPNMAFIGIPSAVAPFPLFHIQVQYYLAVLKAQVQLPIKDEMLEEAKLKDRVKKYAHRLGMDQWSYNDNLAMAGNFEPLPAYYKIGYVAWMREREKHMWNFKDAKFIMSADKQHIRVIPLDSPK